MRRDASRSRRAGVVGVFALLALVSCNLAVNLGDLQGGCPPAKHGATQVKVTSGSSPFCIDTTEATNAQYQVFLDAKFTQPAAQIPDGCQGVTSFTPSQGWPLAPGFEQYPVNHVNWCQAQAFCAWAGKRLCGQIGGGALSPQSAAKTSLSQWLNACSQGGARTYPYGNTFDQNQCGGGGGTGSQLELVKERPGCVGGVPGLYDMSGNLWEWTDTCDPADANNPASGVSCHAVGGAFDSTPAELACDGQPRTWTRSSDAANIGIRCCLDL